MLQLVVHEKGGNTQRFEFVGDLLTIGRGEENTLVLDRANVSTFHLQFRRTGDGVELQDLESTNGTYLNGRKIHEPHIMKRSDRVYIGDFILMLEGDDPAIAPMQSTDLEVAGEKVPVTVPPERGGRGVPLDGDPALLTSARRVGAAGSESRFLDKVADRILEAVLINVRNLDPTQSPSVSEDDRETAAKMIDAILHELGATGQLEEGVDPNAIKSRVLRELCEHGPLEELMKDEGVQEIQAVGGGPIRVIRRGAQSAVVTDLRFSGARALRLAIQRQARAWGFFVEGAQIIEGKVSDGFYMYGLVPPTAVQTPVLTLRRTRTDANSLAALVQEDVMSDGMRELISAAIHGRGRVLVVANGGVNLDRFMGALTGEIPDTHRVVCISDTGQLGAERAGWVQVRRVAEPTDGVALSDALGVILRGGVDLLVSQRCRHEDAAAVIDAMSGATQGAIVSMWGIDSAHGLSRLSALSTVASGAIGALTVALGRSVDLLIRLGTGTAGEPMQVVELLETRVKEGGEVVHMPIFVAQRAAQGKTEFRPTGTQPMFLRKLQAQGISVPLSIFKA
jgi:pilus assembly protein CpaF